MPSVKDYLGDDVSYSSLNIKVGEFEQWVQTIIASVHSLGELNGGKVCPHTCITFGPPE